MRNLRKGANVVILILFVTIFSSLVLASTVITQIDPGYNMGDQFNASIAITPSKTTSNFFIATLICAGKDIELYRSPFNLQSGVQKIIPISTKLDSFLVGGVDGQCYISTEFGDEKSRSRDFRITRKIDITLNIEGVVFTPGDNININGKAQKSKGPLADGQVEITIPGLNLNFFSVVTAGQFSSNLSLPEDSKSGSHQIIAKIFEIDSEGEIINEGEKLGVIQIAQIMKEIEVSLNSPTVSPEKELTYTVMVLDQAKENADTEVALTIIKPDDSTLEKSVARTGVPNTLFIESNFPPGYWTIQSKVADLEDTRTFFVEEKKRLSYTLENETLVLTNVGNVPYEGPVEITIGEVREVKLISKLPVGEVKKFKLAAPDGEYAIQVSDGLLSESMGSTVLTGNAVSVSDIGGILGDNLGILIGMIVILILALVAIVLYKKVLKGQVMTGTHGGLMSKVFKKKEPVMAIPQTKILNKKPAPNTGLIDKGEKQESSIISIKIKNSEILNSKESPALKTLDSALWKAKEQGAKIYSEGDFRLIIFAPILTKEQDNSIKAITIAQTIERIITQYNRRAAKKIEFGIGVNSGNLIVESREGKFKFMSTDNTISATKRISSNSNKEVILSETLHRKTVGKVKVEKLQNENLWKVNKVSDRSQHQPYLKNLKTKNSPRGHDSKKKMTTEVG